MKASLRGLLAILLVFSMITNTQSVMADSRYQFAVDSFSLEKLDPSMTLSEALETYPELFEIYYFRYVSAEEAEESIRNGERVINAEDYSAKEYLSMFNDRRINSEMESNSYAEQKSKGLRSSYGAAWTYVFKTGQNPNCYSYALGVTPRHDPGYYSNSSLSYGSSVSIVAAKVIDDMAALGGSGRTITTNTSSIYNWEWRIACRTGSVLIQAGSTYIEQWDYHFWLQTALGSWCHKPGSGDSEYLGIVTPHTATWGLNGFYNSDTIYLAVCTS